MSGQRWSTWANDGTRGPTSSTAERAEVLRQYRLDRQAETTAAMSRTAHAGIAMGGAGSAVWSHSCDWTDLATVAAIDDPARGQLQLGPGWIRRWSMTARAGAGEVVVPVRDVASVPWGGREPVRRFSWRRAQQHRSGLQFLVSTGRHHGYESLEEARLLLMLDFAGALRDVLSQPMRLRFTAGDGPGEHIPDFFAVTDGGCWLLDVRPAGRIGPRDAVAFAATEQVAATAGRGYAVVTGWRSPAASTVDAFSAQRRELTDRLGVVEMLLSAATAGCGTFGELAAATVAPPVARAYLLHLLWHRRLGMDLGHPLTDHTTITAAPARSAGRR
jgi:hypothetical protein